MAANKSTYLRNLVLETYLESGAHLALFVTDPTKDNTGTEVSGGSYARKPISFGAASGGQKASDADINFTSLPATTVEYWGIYDALTSGHLLYFGRLAAPVTITVGGSFPVLAGNIIITEE